MGAEETRRTKTGSSTKEILRHLLGIAKLDRERNESIREKLGVQNIAVEIKQYQREWLQHVERMDRDSIPKEALKYRPERKRSIGRPRDRWSSFISRDKEQALHLILHSS
jgi:hypothetical protein